MSAPAASSLALSAARRASFSPTICAVQERTCCCCSSARWRAATSSPTKTCAELMPRRGSSRPMRVGAARRFCRGSSRSHVLRLVRASTCADSCAATPSARARCAAARSFSSRATSSAVATAARRSVRFSSCAASARSCLTRLCCSSATVSAPMWLRGSSRRSKRAVRDSRRCARRRASRSSASTSRAWFCVRKKLIAACVGGQVPQAYVQGGSSAAWGRRCAVLTSTPTMHLHFFFFLPVIPANFPQVQAKRSVPTSTWPPSQNDAAGAAAFVAPCGRERLAGRGRLGAEREPVQCGRWARCNHLEQVWRRRAAVRHGGGLPL